MYTVYILFSPSLSRYYVGYTNNICRRLSEHNRKKGKYTDAGIPWELVYTETFKTRNNVRKSLIYCRITVNGERVEISTNERIKQSRMRLLLLNPGRQGFIMQHQRKQVFHPALMRNPVETRLGRDWKILSRVSTVNLMNLPNRKLLR